MTVGLELREHSQSAAKSYAKLRVDVMALSIHTRTLKQDLPNQSKHDRPSMERIRRVHFDLSDLLAALNDARQNVWVWSETAIDDEPSVLAAHRRDEAARVEIEHAATALRIVSQGMKEPDIPEAIEGAWAFVGHAECCLAALGGLLNLHIPPPVEAAGVAA